MILLARGGWVKDIQAHVMGAATIDKCVMKSWERWDMQWRDGRESETEGLTHCGEWWNWRPEGGKEQEVMRRA